MLPRRVNLMTVFGEPIVLPKLQAPSTEDVDKWHATYIEVRENFEFIYFCQFVEALPAVVAVATFE